jgi:hypothetical protein
VCEPVQDRAWQSDDVGRLVGIFESHARRYVESGELGRLARLDVRQVVGDRDYETRSGILHAISGGLLRLLWLAPRTLYWEQRRDVRGVGLLRRWRVVYRYHRLIRSLAQRGFVYDAKEPSSLPWILLTPSINLRLDGHHRSSAWRKLGQQSLPVLVLTPEDVIELRGVPEEDRSFLRQLLERPVSRPSPHGGLQWLQGDKGVFPAEGGPSSPAAC